MNSKLQAVRRPISFVCFLVFWGALQVPSLPAQISSLPPQAWPNSRPITVSFAPDWVEIGRYRNELFMHLNSQVSYPDWQIEILRSFQTWSRHANIQFAVVGDSSRAFGVPGLSQGDPRFGDIRLGAFPQENVLGNAIPYHPSAGSWAGDILFDSGREFYIHEGPSGGSSPSGFYDLYSVALHEAGNSLGLLDNETEIDSVMYFAYVGPRDDLSQNDIQRIQALYGPPSADPYEPSSGNDSFETATPVSFPADFPETLKTSGFGRIQSGDDIDIYRFVAPSLAENCWIKMRARGRSLLCGRITAYDSDGNEITTIAAESPLENNILKEITGLSPGEEIFVVFDWSGVPSFEFGEYEWVLDFNENGGDAEEGDDDGDDDEPERFFEAGDDDLVDLLYSLNGLVDLETNVNNTFASALELISPPGTPWGSRFEIVSSISTATDLDIYRIRTSATATGTMAIDLTPLGMDPAALDIRVFDSNRVNMPIKRRFRATNDVVVEVSNVQPDTDYYIRVQNKTGNSQTGNYLLLVNVADAAAALERIQQVSLNARNPDQFGSFTTYKTQLFRFDLSMNAKSRANQAVQLSIYSDSGRVELVTSARPGKKTVVYAWLQAGEHHVRFTARTLNGAAVLPSTAILDGSSVSDDEGPVLLDPSGNPISGPQTTGSNPTPPPTWDFPDRYVWLYDLIIPTENPW